MMKSRLSLLLPLLLAFAFISTGFAAGGNEGPNGAPATPAPGSRVIAMKSERSGPVAPPYQNEKGIRIYSNGEVTTYIQHMIPAAGDGETRLTQIDPIDLRRLQAEIDSLHDLQLVDQNAGSPVCIGGGSVHYSVMQSGTSGFSNIQIQAGCHKSVLKNNEGSKIVEYLDQLEALAYTEPSVPGHR